GINGVVHEPILAGIVGRHRVVARRVPEGSLSKNRAVNLMRAVSQRLEWAEGGPRARDIHGVMRVRAAAILSRVDKVVVAAACDDPGGFHQMLIVSTFR